MLSKYRQCLLGKGWTDLLVVLYIGLGFPKQLLLLQCTPTVHAGIIWLSDVILWEIRTSDVTLSTLFLLRVINWSLSQIQKICFPTNIHGTMAG